MKAVKEQKETNDIGSILQSGGKILQELNDPVNEMLDNHRKIINEFKKIATDDLLVAKNVDVIRLNDLLEEPKKVFNKTSGANAILAYKEFKDGVFKIYMCFLKDTDMIDQDDNKYFLVTGFKLSRDVDNLFDKDTIIIK